VPILHLRCRTTDTSGIDQDDPDPLVDPALALVSGHPDATDLAGVRDVRPAVRLEVEPDDLDGPDRLDPSGAG
jgi:hypothetical protein